MKKIENFSRGMGIGGWLTNYKRFHVLPEHRRLCLTIGDLEHFDTYITKRDIAYIAGLGLDHVRLGFDQIVLEEAPFTYRESVLRILRNFVSWCHTYGLRPVFNLHKALGNYCDVASERGRLMKEQPLMDRFVALWEMLEQEFHGDTDVIFELLNEVADAPAEAWNALAARTLAAIRRTNASRYVIIGGIHYNAPFALREVKVYDDPYVIYTFHCYEPFEFTHQRGVLQAEPLFYNRSMSYPSEDIERYRDYKRTVQGAQAPYAQYDRMDKAFLYDYLAPAKEFITAHPDKILWCGEFGTIRHADIESRENWMRDVIAILKEWDIPYSVWNYLSTPNDGNRFSLVDDDRREIVSERMARVIRGEA